MNGKWELRFDLASTLYEIRFCRNVSSSFTYTHKRDKPRRVVLPALFNIELTRLVSRILNVKPL